MTLGKIVIEGVDPATVQFDDPNKRNLVAEVSSKVCNSLWHYGPLNFLCSNMKHCNYFFCLYQAAKVFNPNGEFKIIAVDCGIKYNQIRCLVTRGASVKVAPWNYDFNVDVEKGGKQAFLLFLHCLSWKSFVCSSLYANFKFERLQNTLEQQSCCCKTPSCNHFVCNGN